MGCHMESLGMSGNSWSQIDMLDGLSVRHCYFLLLQKVATFAKMKSQKGVCYG